ncbi:PD-(D/E)XK nuclease-like domain-containing protein [Cereibacter sphaeroides]|jgi:hypothetical protein|uniref:PD-(D/E)XK nuclease-like domain-containing protein n=1 Tax=Cereibacter sphaeroides TaxID=1063 RepID=UPI0000663F2E|nr:hypothetical protein Rsph17029_0667 [Cereibacter sphaeroides ATCC 17029]
MLLAGTHSIDAEAYHADPAPKPSLSSTLARIIINHSPRHAWTAHPKLNPNWQPTESETFDIGRAAHRAILGRGGEYVAIPEHILASNGAASTKEAKAFIADARALGRTPLKQDKVDGILAMRLILQHRLREMKIELDPACSEIAAIAEIDGTWCRCMVDNAPKDRCLPLYDFKTTMDASPEAIRKSIETYGYDVQMAHYLDVWKAATGEDRDFVFIFQEKEPPHEVGVAKLLNFRHHPADFMEEARDKAHTARQVWGSCVETGNWPGYPPLIIEIGATAFHKGRWMEKAGRVAANKPDKKIVQQAADWQRP